ncbi:hypothetical protein Tco_1546925 [Tanacetum coccineum]
MASLRLQSKVKMMIQGVFFVVWWLVWSYRNKLLFEEKKPSKAIIFDDVVSISFYWYKSSEGNGEGLQSVRFCDMERQDSGTSLFQEDENDAGHAKVLAPLA